MDMTDNSDNTVIKVVEITERNICILLNLHIAFRKKTNLEKAVKKEWLYYMV